MNWLEDPEKLKLIAKAGLEREVSAIVEFEEWKAGVLGPVTEKSEAAASMLNGFIDCAFNFGRIATLTYEIGKIDERRKLWKEQGKGTGLP